MELQFALRLVMRSLSRASPSCCVARSRTFTHPTIISSRCQSTKAGSEASAHEISSESRVLPVNELAGGVDLADFRHHAWFPELPLAIRQAHSLPAMTKWFQSSGSTKGNSFSEYMKSFGQVIVPYELSMNGAATGNQGGSDESADTLSWLKRLKSGEDTTSSHIANSILQQISSSGSSFHRFDAPLSLIQNAAQSNDTGAELKGYITRLYIAQSDIRDLPGELVNDLPVPEIVRKAGKGDIYNSSIWLGLLPTMTPLHRDPNPNLFCQLLGSKSVRLLPPRVGQGLYSHIQRSLGAHGNAQIRGMEMMEGPERVMLHQAVWVNDLKIPELLEVHLEPGDALFIPKGWWHSVAGRGIQGSLNASANWWFR